MKDCSQSGCPNPAQSRGMCSSHYNAWRKAHAALCKNGCGRLILVPDETGFCRTCRSAGRKRRREELQQAETHRRSHEITVNVSARIDFAELHSWPEDKLYALMNGIGKVLAVR